MADTMSTIETGNLLIAGSLGVYARPHDPEATDYPVDIADPGGGETAAEAAHAQLIGLGFAHLGATIKDGSNFKETKQRTKHYVHQQRQPVAVTEDQVEAVFTSALHEFDEDAIINAYGGGEITTTANGNQLYLPPANGELHYITFVVDALYNGEVTRLVMERCTSGGETDLALKPTELSGLPITVDALSPVQTERAWYLIRPAAVSGS